MLGDITALEPGSKKASEARRMFLRSQRLWVCPTKAPCVGVVVVMAMATTELEQSCPGFPQSLSLVSYNSIMFPDRGLSESASRESQAALAGGLVVACSGGPPRVLGKQSP